MHKHLLFVATPYNIVSEFRQTTIEKKFFHGEYKPYSERINPPVKERGWQPGTVKSRSNWFQVKSTGLSLIAICNNIKRYLDKRKVGSKANGSTNTQRNGTMFLFHLTVQDGTEPCEYLD